MEVSNRDLAFEFFAGVIVALVFTQLIIPAFMQFMIQRELVTQIEEGKLPFPFHMFGPHSLKTTIARLAPDAVPYLTDEVISTVHTTVQTKYNLQIKAAVEGISSDEEMVAYLKDSGLLEELGLDETPTLQRLRSMNYSKYYFEPLANSTQYYPNTPPVGVRLPAEYEPIGAVLVSWPVYYEPGAIWDVHTSLVGNITSDAEAWILVPNKYWQKGIHLYLSEKGVDLSNVTFFHIPSNGVWTRDYGPTTVIGANNSSAFIWNPYIIDGVPYSKSDVEVGTTLGLYLDVPVYRLPIVIEGGNIISDGKGTIMVMDSVLTNNADIDQSHLESIMEDYYGAKRLIILPEAPGELCGHIDLIVKFVDEDTLLVAQAPVDHKWHDSLESIADQLENITAANGKNYEVIRVLISSTTDETAEWSYINSLTLNSKVLVPIYGTPEDEQALELYRQAMPEYEIIGINDSIYPIGAIHCQTKEIPLAATNNY
ncbi:agmatine deiminase family protein [Candidatus Micrarchaeota archaeon]|nr:agmatine deiminase family protein [Candidatus Micrarchaeota archaeon]